MPWGIQGTLIRICDLPPVTACVRDKWGTRTVAKHLMEFKVSTP